MLRRLTVAMVMAATACTSSSGEQAVTTTETTTVAADPTTTTAPVDTTTSTIEPDAEPQWTPEEIEVIEAYRAYQDAWELATEDWDQGIEAIRATSAGDYGTDVETSFVEARDAGSVLRGTRTYEVLSIEFVDTDRAVLADCGLGQFELVDATGAVVSAANTERDMVDVYFERSEGQWLVVGRLSQSSC